MREAREIIMTGAFIVVGTGFISVLTMMALVLRRVRKVLAEGEGEEAEGNASPSPALPSLQGWYGAGGWWWN